MKKCYVHLERLPEYEIKKCFVNAYLKNEIKIEYHDDLTDNIYNDYVSKLVFYWIIRIRMLSVNFKSSVMKYEKYYCKRLKAHDFE